MIDTDIAKRLSQMLATQKFSDGDLKSITSGLKNCPFPITDVDVCTQGIVIDCDLPGDLGGLNLDDFINSNLGPIRDINIFPIGIILPEGWRARIKHLR